MDKSQFRELIARSIKTHTGTIKTNAVLLDNPVGYNDTRIEKLKTEQELEKRFVEELEFLDDCAKDIRFRLNHKDYNPK